MSIDVTLRKHGVRLFWWPVAAINRYADRRWLEVYWMRYNLTVIIYT